MSTNMMGRFPRLAVSSHSSIRMFASGKKALKKAPPPPPPKYRKVCRHIFPYPRCIDLYSLRPEPYCIETGGPCRSGNWLLLFAGLALFGIGSYLAATLRVNQLWYNFEEEDECCDEDEE